MMNIDLSGVQWIVDTVNNVYKIHPPIAESMARKKMSELGFGYGRAADPDKPVTSYSGGWKVKIQLVAGSLCSADILMLDEPTGHMDTTNQGWLKDWLKKFPGSIIVTSHDRIFLDE